MQHQLRFRLNLCDCAAPQDATDRDMITYFGRSFQADYHGEIDVDYEFLADTDRIRFSVPEQRVTVSLGLASRLLGVVLRVRDGGLSIQGIYNDPQLMFDEVCCHCDRTDVWGSGDYCECSAW